MTDENIARQTAKQCTKLIIQNMPDKYFDESYLENCIVQAIINAEG